MMAALFHYSLLPIRYSPLTTRYSPLSRLHQRAIVEPAVEPVLIAGDILLHRDIDEGLVQRNPRHLGKREIDEALDVGIVGRLVAGRGRAPRAVDQPVPAG